MQERFESPPNRTIQKLCMIRRSHDDDVWWQPINLHEQRTHDSLYFAHLRIVTAFLRNRLEFIKEQNTRASPNEFEEAVETTGSFSKERSDESLIPHGKEWQV